MRIEVNGAYGKYHLLLGVASTPEKSKEHILSMARAWAPRHAQSMDIRMQFSSEPVEYRFEVYYYTARKEGKFRVYKHYTEMFYSEPHGFNRRKEEHRVRIT